MSKISALLWAQIVEESKEHGSDNNCTTADNSNDTDDMEK